MSAVMLEVANLTNEPGVRVTAELQWLGEARQVPLVDDGSVASDLPHDNVFVGHVEGEAVRLLPVRLLVTHADGHGVAEEVWSGVEAVDGGDARLVYELVSERGQLHAERVPAPWFGQPRPGNESECVVINGVWIVLAMLTVAWLARPVRMRT